jgi:hypothetical protein
MDERVAQKNVQIYCSGDALNIVMSESHVEYLHSLFKEDLMKDSLTMALPMGMVYSAIRKNRVGLVKKDSQ